MVGASDDAPLILSSWHEWEMTGRERRIVLCVETSLELRPGHKRFDAARLEALIEEATGLMRESPSPIDALRIVPSDDY